MSILALLASNAAAPVGGDPPPPGSADQRPPLDDPIAVSMRPSGAPVAVVRVGPSRQYTLPSQGMARAVQLRNTSIVAAGKSVPGSALDAYKWALLRRHRVDVIIDPGSYIEDETVEYGVPALVSLYAGDGQRRSVAINAGFETSGWNYLEGIAITPPKIGGSKYAVHHSNVGTSIFSRCGFDTRGRTGGMGGGTPFGMDGAFNLGLQAETYFLDCAFQGGTSTNLHGGAGGDRDVIAYIKCSYAGGNLQYGGGTNLATVWGVDCTAGSINGYGDYTTTHLSGCTLETASTTVDTDRSDWPVPIGGLSPYWRTQLGL